MKQINLISLFSWTITHISWMTMAFSPVALGKEAENFKTQKIKNDIQALGLNKKSTVSEFWNKSKFYIPGYAYEEFEKYSKINSTKLMPTFEVKSTKNSLGEETPVIQINQNGKTTTVQLLGDKEKYVKINNQYFTEKEVQNPKVLFAKLIQSDAKLKTELNQSIKKNNYDLQDEKSRPFRNFSGMPRFNKQLWSAMSVQQRVAYIVEMRLLNEKAMLVQEAFASQNKKSKKTSSYESFKKYQAAWEFLVGEAHAAPYFNGQHCLNQGFIADNSTAYIKTNGKKESCNLNTILKSNRYSKDPVVQKAVKDCADSVPCNPLVYSFDKNGKAFCAPKQDDPKYQQGTHFAGTCDSQARLTGKNPDGTDTFIKVSGLRGSDEQSRIGNVGEDLTKINHADAKKAIEASQALDGFAATEAYLLGLLKAGKNDPLVQLLNQKTWTPELETELLKIQVAFEENITDSMTKCSTELKNTKIKHEDNYRNACEQLHRRWLFTEKFISTFKCKDEVRGGVILDRKANGASFEKEIKPVVGTKEDGGCAKNPVPAVVVVPAKPVNCTADSNHPEECLKKPDADISETQCKDAPALLSSGECLCENGQPPQVKEQGFFSKIFHTDDGQKDRTPEYECSSGINWWLVGGIAAGIGLLALLFKNKDKNTTCTNGGTPPDCIVNSQCPVGSTGTPPDKCFAAGQCPPGATTPFPECLGAGKCPTGTTGTFPNCLGQGQCPVGSTGTFPNCLGTGRCPTGTTGTFPNCLGQGQCPAGSTGTFPNCFGNVTCQGNQQLINGACRCASSCTVVGSTQNPVSCVCTTPPSEGGSGHPTCPNPPCNGGVPVIQ